VPGVALRGKASHRRPAPHLEEAQWRLATDERRLEEGMGAGDLVSARLQGEGDAPLVRRGQVGASLAAHVAERAGNVGQRRVEAAGRGEPHSASRKGALVRAVVTEASGHSDLREVALAVE